MSVIQLHAGNQAQSNIYMAFEYRDSWTGKPNIFARSRPSDRRAPTRQINFDSFVQQPKFAANCDGSTRSRPTGQRFAHSTFPHSKPNVIARHHFHKTCVYAARKSSVILDHRA
jgi:hypothetical protein